MPLRGGSTPNGKYHLKFPFWLSEHLPNVTTSTLWSHLKSQWLAQHHNASQVSLCITVAPTILDQSRTVMGAAMGGGGLPLSMSLQLLLTARFVRSVCCPTPINSTCRPFPELFFYHKKWGMGVKTSTVLNHRHPLFKIQYPFKTYSFSITAG